MGTKGTQHHRKPMNVTEFMNFMRLRKGRRSAPIRSVYSRVADVQFYDPFPQKFLDGLRKRWGDTLPNDERIIVGEHDALARRIRKVTGEFGKTYVIHSMNQLLDLFFHDRGSVDLSAGASPVPAPASNKAIPRRKLRKIRREVAA